MDHVYITRGTRSLQICKANDLQKSEAIRHGAIIDATTGGSELIDPLALTAIGIALRLVKRRKAAL